MRNTLKWAVKNFGSRTATGMCASAAVCVVLLLTGCAALNVQETGTVAGAPVAGAALHGIVHGGNQPSTGAVIQLYQVGLTGYGSAATPLLTNPVTTGPGGSFSITGDYTCSTGTLVYMTATGGNPGLSGSVNNKASAMMVALGDCGTLLANAATTTIWINEVTTAAAVWALQQFIAIVPGTTLYAQPGTNPVTSGTPPAFSIGTSATNLQGLKYAFEIAQLLATTNTGTSPGAFPASSPYIGPGTSANRVLTVETWQLNTIADILSTCVNTDSTAGDAGYSSMCSTLATDVVPSSTTAPADTLQIAYDMAQNPSYNVSTVFGFVSAIGAPFLPVASAVNDWTVAYNLIYTYVGGAGTNDETVLNTGVSLAFDSFGNAWIMNTGHGYSYLAPFLTELDGVGNYVSQYTNYNTGTIAAPVTTGFAVPALYNAQMLVSIDPANNVYTPDYGNGNLVRVAAASGAGVAGGTAFGLSLGTGTVPSVTASDANGNIYVALGGSTAATTIPTANAKGLALVVPSLATGGPLTAAAGSGIQTTANNSFKAIAVTQNSTSTYDGGGFLYLSSTANPCSTATGFGTSMNAYFTNSATITGSSSNTTIKQGQIFPFAEIVNSNTSSSCGSTYIQVPNLTETYAGTNYTIPAFDTINGLGVDSADNLWIVNALSTAPVSGYPEYWVTQLTPTYSANPLTGSLQVSYSPAAFTAPILLGSSGGATPTFVPSVNLVIDGANNAWVASSGGGGALVAVNATAGVLSPQNPINVAVGTNTWICGGFCGSTYSAGYNSRRNSMTSGNEVGVDLAGNVWRIFAGSGSDSISIVVGAAAPTVAPLSLAAKNHTSGTRP